MTAAVIFVIFPLCLSIAAFSDLFTMTIPNRVSLILAASFIVMAPIVGLGWHEIGLHLLGGMVVFAICFTLFAFNIMGGGDAKLLSAAALWFGFDGSLMMFCAYVSYVGGMITLLILMLRSSSNTILAMGLPVPSSLLLAKKVPYGIAIAIGGFLAFPSSPLLVAALQGVH